MIIEEIDSGEYKGIFNNCYHVFNTASFNHLNASKVEQIYYLVFKDKKVRFGLVAGYKSGVLTSPFSAPFGGFTFVREDITLIKLDETIAALLDWCSLNKVKEVQLILPPLIYQRSFISKMVNALFRSEFQIRQVDLNYSFDLRGFSKEKYLKLIKSNTRNKLKNALRNELNFHLCIGPDHQRQAYEIIESNRKAKGYPLRMTWEQIRMTIELVDADFFMVMQHEIPIAAAMVFHVSPEIVQVIYWGDLVDFAHLRPMNYLAYELFSYYFNKGKLRVDIGPSTENSIPNHGLGDFKESIGCMTDLKFSFSKTLG